MVKAVLFDYAGVLTEGGTQGSVTRLVAAALGIPASKVRPMGGLLTQLFMGTVTTGQFLKQLQAAYPLAQKPTRAKLLQNADIFVPSAPVYALAAALRKKGIKTGILSNMFELSATSLRKRGLYDGFDPVVLSCEERLAKPDPEFYERAVQKLGVAGNEIIFVDDQERFRAPAELLGMHFILAESPLQIVADVESLIFEYDGIRLDD
ncbi:MAG TPA: HAD family phosphatase [Candidatus Saccharimonadales bacterium]|nr:HAD family phosphatase [Candidatus Saccharimonadales bacterium]